MKLSEKEPDGRGSGYLIARSGQGKKDQKDLFYELLAPVFFGEKEAETESELADFFSRQYGIDVYGDFCEGDAHYEEYREARQALAEGMAVYGGRIDFDENALAELAEKIWTEMEQKTEGGFRRINTLLEE